MLFLKSCAPFLSHRSCAGSPVFATEDLTHFLTAITLAEILLGIELLSTGKRREVLRAGGD